MQFTEVISGPQAQSGALATTLIGTWIGHVWGYLPSTVALVGGILAIAWYSIMLWESKTVQDWHARSSARRKIAKIAKLKAEVKIATAQLEAMQGRQAAAAEGDAKVLAATAEATLIQAHAGTAQTVAELQPKNGGAP